MGEDPIGFRGKDFNFYRYVKNSPVGLKDPLGLASISEFEAHFIGGAGILSITCIDENCNGRTHIYLKICLGAAVGGSGSVGYVGNADGKSCSSPLPYLLGGELGGALLAGVDAGVAVATNGSGASASGSLPALGLSQQNMV